MEEGQLDMEILSYREIDSKDDLTQLLDHVFNWVFNQKEFDDFVARAI
jgi:hypothetical protein